MNLNFSRNIWNNLLQPPDRRVTNLQTSRIPITCPSQAVPYFYTKFNSVKWSQSRATVEINKTINKLFPRTKDCLSGDCSFYFPCPLPAPGWPILLLSLYLAFILLPLPTQSLYISPVRTCDKDLQPGFIVLRYECRNQRSLLTRCKKLYRSSLGAVIESSGNIWLTVQVEDNVQATPSNKVSGLSDVGSSKFSEVVWQHDEYMII